MRWAEVEVERRPDFLPFSLGLSRNLSITLADFFSILLRVRETDQTRRLSLCNHHEIQAPSISSCTTNFPYFLLIFAQGTCPIACVIKLSKLSNSDQFPSIQRSSMVVWLRGGFRSFPDM